MTEAKNDKVTSSARYRSPKMIQKSDGDSETTAAASRISGMGGSFAGTGSIAPTFTPKAIKLRARTDAGSRREEMGFES